MVYRIIWSPGAVSHFEDLCNYIEKDSKYYAILFAKRINIVVKALAKFPMSGRIVPEYDDENLREKIYENYRIVYRIKGKTVEVVAICHGARLLDEIV